MELRARSHSGPELILETAIVALRVTNVSRSLRLQRNVAFADSAKLSRIDNAFMVFGLASAALDVVFNSLEIYRRVKAEESLLEIEPVRDPNPEFVAGAVIGTSVSAVEIVRGTTLFKRRPLSAHGRILRSVSTIASLSRLGLHFAAVAKGK